MSDSEDDFMSDAFLAKVTAGAAPKASSGTTYQERRRRAAASSQARADANRIRPLREREEEARQEGLKKNLIEDELRKRDAGGEVGVGMKMMLKMGYQGGERLGRQDAAPGNTGPASDVGNRPGEAVPPAEDLEDDQEAEAALGGLGSRKRIKLDVPTLAAIPPQQPEASSTKPKAAAGGHLLEPLAISIWAGRKGLGARAKAVESAQPRPPAKVLPLDTSVYRSRASEEYAEKKAEGQLRNAQKTVLSLDARDDKGFSILHLSPTDASTFPPPLLDALALITSDDAPGPSDDQTAALRLKSQMEADALAPLSSDFGDDNDDYDDQVGQTSLGGLQKSREVTTQRVADALAVEIAQAGEAATSDAEDWAVLAIEARKLLQLPASQRLPLTLQYLRDEYSYCFFCGCGYESQEALAAQCPGLTEEDHD